MKSAVATLFIGLVLTVPVWAAGQDRSISKSSTRDVLALAKTGLSTLSLLPVDRDDEDLLWACWSEDGPTRKTSIVALIRRQGRSARLIWSARYADAYEPVIAQIYGPLTPGVSALLLHYQTGADDAHATLLSVNTHDFVSVIGSVRGQTVDLLPWADNTIRASSGPGDPPICYGWKTGTGTLARRPCQ